MMIRFHIEKVDKQQMMRKALVFFVLVILFILMHNPVIRTIIACITVFYFIYLYRLRAAKSNVGKQKIRNRAAKKNNKSQECYTKKNQNAKDSINKKLQQKQQKRFNWVIDESDIAATNQYDIISKSGNKQREYTDSQVKGTVVNEYTREDIKKDLQNRLEVLKRYSYMTKSNTEDKQGLLQQKSEHAEMQQDIKAVDLIGHVSDSIQDKSSEKADNMKADNVEIFDKSAEKGQTIENLSLNEDIDEPERANKHGDTTEYQAPVVSILNCSQEKNIDAFDDEVNLRADKLIETLNSFGVKAKIVNICKGPSVTRFEVQPEYGVKVSKIVNLADDIALNLAAEAIRMEAPIPGKAAVGIEIPNTETSPVLISEVIASEEFQKHPSKIAFAVGKDISGKVVVEDIAKMPHLLIAGATGSGKSVCINTLIASILYKASPDEVKLIMIDPKVVELGVYNGIPHLLVPVVTDPKKAAGALAWAVKEMLERYKLFADNGVRDIKGYNSLLKSRGEDRALCQIVIIIDELADLMIAAPNEVEDSICRLAQMARAAGMHLVIATQRPSVDVITGVIKANIPSRIAFAVSSQVDSRTILDMAGAEKLLGKGDMLFYPLGRPKPLRVQGALINDKEVEELVKHVKSNFSAQYDENVIDCIDNSSNDEVKSLNDVDELLKDAVEAVIDQGQASTSFIQRKFRIGYSRAARILDQMEERGIVGPFEGSKPRKVLISKEEFYEMFLNDAD